MCVAVGAGYMLLVGHEGSAAAQAVPSTPTRAALSLRPRGAHPLVLWCRSGGAQHTATEHCGGRGHP